MNSKFLPSVLQRPHFNSISMERALKQCKELLEMGNFPFVEEQVVINSIEDLETMLSAINRGDQ